MPGTDLCLLREESSPFRSKVACKLGGLQQVMSKLLSNDCDHAKGCASLHHWELKTTFKGKPVPFSCVVLGENWGTEDNSLTYLL